MILNNFRNKTVIVTGHTGFKGSWLSQWLVLLGANVIGVSSSIPSKPSHYELINLKKNIINKKNEKYICYFFFYRSCLERN